MTYFRTALGAIFSVLLSLAMMSPASAVLFKTSVDTSIQIGNLLITNTQCSATSGGTVSCANATWSVANSSNGGGVYLTITPSIAWTSTAPSDLSGVFSVQSLNGSNVPTSSLKYVGGAGAALVGSGTSLAIAGGISVTDSVGGGLGAVQEPFGAGTWQTASTNAASPANSISFAPQSVVYISFDFAPLSIGGSSTITSASIFIARAPEPATVAVMLVAVLMLAGLRRQRL